MIEPRLNDFFCADIDRVHAWVPTSPSRVRYYLEMTIGPDPHCGEIFGLTVVTPQALAQMGDATISGRHKLIVPEYSWAAVLRFIDDVLRKCRGESWGEVAVKLSRHFAWEYEDYVEVPE